MAHLPRHVAIRRLLLASLFPFFATAASGETGPGGDPCAGLAMDPTASVARWLACYRTVPFDDAVRHNILDGIEDQLTNWSTVPPLYRAGAVPSGEPLDILTELTGPGSFLRTHEFPSDYDFHVAVATELIPPLQNRHNYYYGVPCYQNIFWNPLTLSSTTRFGNEQIVFVDRASLGGAFEGLEDLLGTPALDLGGLTAAEYYELVLGGPDVTRYEGLRVVSINGVDALEAVRAYGNRLNHSSNPSNRFNEALRAINSRSLGPGRLDVPLEDDALDLEYVFEDRSGRRIGPVSIPLKALGLSPGEFGAPMDRASFRSACEAPSPFTVVDQPGTTAGSEARGWASAGRRFPAEPSPSLSRGADADGLARYRRGLHQARRSMRAAWEAAGTPAPRHRGRDRTAAGARQGAGFFDMPPGNPGFETRVLEEFPYDDGLATTVIRVYDVGQRAVALEIPSWSSDEAWLIGVASGVNRACDTGAEQLIVDLRRFPGGAGAAKALFSFFLFEPDQARIAARDPTLHLDHEAPEQFRRTEYLVSLAKQSFLASRLTGGAVPAAFDPEDSLDLDGNFLTPAAFDEREEVDLGNGVVAEYFPPIFQNAFSAYDPSFDFPVNRCPGRFSGARLIILDDGNAGSGGPIWTRTNRDRATVVTTGGDLASGVPTSMGQRLGGATASWQELALLHSILTVTGGSLGLSPEFPLMRAPFLRDVDMDFEVTQVYERRDSDVLTGSRETEPDATIETWVARLKRGADLDRYAYVYTRAIRAAKRLR